MSSTLAPGTADATVNNLWPAPDPHAGDPLAWARTHGLELWSGQQRMLLRAEGSRKSGTPSGHGTGKSHTAAIWIAYGCTSLPDVSYLHTCPTAAQLQNILRPLREIHRQLGLPGYITDGQVPEWKLNGRVVYRGRAAADGGTSNLAGPHAENMRVIVDEADGMAANQWSQIMGMLTGEDNRLATFGNPVDPASAWRDYCKSDSWDVEHLSVLDTPAFTGERVSNALKKVLPSADWVEDARSTWGEGTALWESRVAGQWADAADKAILSLSLVAEARRHPDERPEDQHQFGDDRPLYACDVAGDGEDRTVIGRILERSYRTLEVRQDWDTEDAADALIRLLNGHPGARVVVDADGLGAGVRDKLRARGYGHRTVAFKAGERPRRPDDHRIVRDEAWWGLRTALGTSVRLDPDDPHAEQLAGEITAIRYVEDSQGRICAEKKDDTKKRLGRSPDLGDALMMAVYGLRAGVQHVAPRRGKPRPGGLLNQPI